MEEEVTEPPLLVKEKKTSTLGLRENQKACKEMICR